MATVSAAGVVTGVAVGEAEITATGADTGVTGRHAVVVTPTGSNEPAVAITGAHGVLVGETLTLDASTVNGTDSGYTWASSDAAVATVSAAGVVTGVAAGEAIISATGTDTDAEGTHAVVVVDEEGTGTPVIVVTGDVFLRIGGTSSYAAVTVNGTDASYDWASSHPNIATVDAVTGEVIGRSTGTAVITATGADTAESGTLSVHVSLEIPNEPEWLSSGHADYASEAFRHWDGDGSVPTTCAKCHSAAGFEDYLGADGSAAFVVDASHIPSRTVDCNSCHNPTAQALSKVIFPSGVEVNGLGGEARCMTCHQGRESTDSVESAISNAAVATDDTVSASLSFRNIHYAPSGATLNGGRVRGGYQYDGQMYDWRFRHVPGYAECQGCHDPHSGELKVAECADCHTGVSTVADLRSIRMISSLGKDYDGDGDTSGGLYHEIEGLAEKLYEAIQTYASEMAGTDDICYSSASHPYWFIDTNANGTCEVAEVVSSNKYVTFTSRLVRATYNYQLALKDHGAYAHNGKYLIQLLHDSIADLSSVVTTPVDMSAAVRNDLGHFDGTTEAFRHWDEDPTVGTSCSKCHGGSDGFRHFAQYGQNKAGVEQANGLDCATCHNDLRTPSSLAAVATVTFPGDVKASIQATGDTFSNACGTCHSGRESKTTIDAYAGTSFRNVHYLPAAGVYAGTAGKVGYEYLGKTYAGTFALTAMGANHAGCKTCHKPLGSGHSFAVDDGFTSTAGGALNCGGCHSGTSVATSNFRLMSRVAVDYDGDGSSTESLADEIGGLGDALMAQMSTFALANGMTNICYSSSSPYLRERVSMGSGECDPVADTVSYALSNTTNGRKLMRAGHNLHLSHKEHGAWAHNFSYMAQLLIDSIEDLGGSVSGFVRP